ncbi:MAG: NAD(P)H-quinone oxidoreductase [Chloroflexota bacterium]|nr:NAD(P)H-quinone oxidoreductase [Chloroflexota bacterium]
MQAVVLQGAGGPEVLRVREVPTPEPGLEQVRVRVRSAGLNRSDLLQRRGRYPAPPGSPSDIPGLEFAGVVEALGPGASMWRVGQRVYGITGGAAQAEYVVSHERMLAPIPDALDDVAAGGVPGVFMTVLDALFAQADLRSGESVLIHAVGSGIGTAAVQLACAASARTIGTSRTRDKLDRARAIGLDVGIEGADFASAVMEHTEGQGANVVLDAVGGAYVAADLEALAMNGRVVVLATQAGGEVQLPLGHLMGKRMRLMGSTLRPRPLEEKILLTRMFAAQVNPLLASGRVRPIVDSVFDLAQVAEAHARLESNQTFGKVILRLAS